MDRQIGRQINRYINGYIDGQIGYIDLQTDEYIIFYNFFIFIFLLNEKDLKKERNEDKWIHNIIRKVDIEITRMERQINRQMNM